jgi:uncharacterized SAM-binding protein YcdF (DUF218 family)
VSSGRTTAVKAAALIVFLALPEAAFWLAARSEAPMPPAGSCAVLVLGYPTRRNGEPSRVQRYRVEIGVDVFKSQRCELMVLAGGSPHSSFIEAETMARLAQDAGIPREKLALEGRSRSTWENIQFALPALEKSPRVLIVSDPLHVRRGKRYWCRQRPDRCADAFMVSRYEPLNLYWMKWGSLVGESLKSLRDFALPLKTAGPSPPATRP